MDEYAAAERIVVGNILESECNILQKAGEGLALFIKVKDGQGNSSSFVTPCFFFAKLPINKGDKLTFKQL
jgi:hypothetical protein